VLLSLLSPKGKARTAVSRLRSSLATWRDLDAARAPPAERQAAYARLLDAEMAVRALPEEYRALIHERQTLREMLAEAHGRQAAAMPPTPELADLPPAHQPERRPPQAARNTP
jgi:tellurite resistance protein TerC